MFQFRFFGIFLATLFSFTTLSSYSLATCIEGNCDALGYTKTEDVCEGDIIRCPFDTSKVFCKEKNLIPCPNPKIGDILYSDMTCSSEMISGKTPIAVVIHDNTRTAIALTTRLTYWAAYPYDIPGLTNYSGSATDFPGTDGNSVINTNTIVSYCTSKGYACPAAQQAHAYSTEGTQPGDWFLSSAGNIYALYYSKDILKPILSELGLSSSLIFDSCLWTSTEASSSYAWCLNMTNGAYTTSLKINANVAVFMMYF